MAYSLQNVLKIDKFVAAPQRKNSKNLENAFIRVSEAGKLQTHQIAACVVLLQYLQGFQQTPAFILVAQQNISK